MLQEFQWSRNLTQVLLSWTRGYFKLGMSLGQKIHFLFGQLWYVMYAAFMLIGNTLPLVAIGTDRPLVQINLLDFWLLAMPATVMVLIPIMYLKGLGLLRPSEYDAVCLETIVFSYIRWPWALWGVVYGTIGALKGTELPFKVTKKGENGIKPFPLRVVMPYLAGAHKRQLQHFSIRPCQRLSVLLGVQRRGVQFSIPGNHRVAY